MKTIKEILIPIDGSDRSSKALMKGLSFAKLVSAKVTVMHIFEKPTISPWPVVHIPKKKIKKMLDKSVENLLNHAEEVCRNHAVPYNEKIFEGQPTKCIIEHRRTSI